MQPAMYWSASGAGDPAAKTIPEEQPGERRHRERLDEPVDEQRHEQAARPAADVADGAEVDLHHHRRDHQPDQHRDRDIDLAARAELEPAQGVHEHRRRRCPSSRPGHHAQRDPQRQVALEDRLSVSRRCRPATALSDTSPWCHRPLTRSRSGRSSLVVRLARADEGARELALDLRRDAIHVDAALGQERRAHRPPGKCARARPRRLSKPAARSFAA